MDYNEQDIDQMIDEILEQPETVEKICRKRGASFEAKRGSTRTLCPACFREARAANGRMNGKKSTKAGPSQPPAAAALPGGEKAGTSPEGPLAPGMASQGAAAREHGALTVGKLLELLGSVPRDAVIREVTAVELRSIWTPSKGQRAELYFRRRGEL